VLLMPVIARHCVVNIDRHALQRFRGAVVVAIDGVDFAPYVHILRHPCKGATIADPVVVVTDTDPHSPRPILTRVPQIGAVTDRLDALTNAVRSNMSCPVSITAPCCARCF
jgi:putative ATP-dependent endonuclease of the OLD family